MHCWQEPQSQWSTGRDLHLETAVLAKSCGAGADSEIVRNQHGIHLLWERAPILQHALSKQPNGHGFATQIGRCWTCLCAVRKDCEQKVKLDCLGPRNQRKLTKLCWHEKVKTLRREVGAEVKKKKYRAFNGNCWMQANSGGKHRKLRASTHIDITNSPPNG